MMFIVPLDNDSIVIMIQVLIGEEDEDGTSAVLMAANCYIMYAVKLSA